MKARLRDIEDGEHLRVLAIVEQVLASYGLKIDPAATDSDLADIKRHYLGRGGVFKVLDDGGIIVGSYGLYPMSNEICELRKMYLLPQYQGQGLGRLMMDDALNAARQKGFKEMVLETNSVLDKATVLYRKYGFEPYVPDHLSARCDCAMRLKL